MVLRESEGIAKKIPLIVAVIPAYNEASNITRTIEGVSRYVSTVIVVDDGSSDNTAELANRMKAIVVRFKHNKGKGAALKRGVIASLTYDPDIIITIDADGQHDPEEIPKLVIPIEAGQADIVIGSRYASGCVRDVPATRGLGLTFINFINKNLMSTAVRDSQSGFRAYSKNVLDTILRYSDNGYGGETQQLAVAESCGFRIMEVPALIKYKGLKNTSKKNPFIHAATVISTILKIAVENRPLLFFGLPGIVLILGAIASASLSLLYYNETRYFSIPLALITLGLAFLGLIFVFMGIILSQLGRIRTNR